MFNSFRLSSLGVFIIFLLLLHFGTTDTVAQERYGTLTGTITSPEGKPINSNGVLLAKGVFVNLEEWSMTTAYNPGGFRKRGVFNDVDNAQSRVSSDLKLGGLYTFRNLRPGVYNLVVEEGVQLDNKNGGYIYYRPQRIVGLVVKAGQETVYDITLHSGDKLQQSGDPKNNTLEMVGDPKGDVQEGLKRGWLEGTVTNSDGQPVWSATSLLVSGATVKLKKSTGAEGTFPTDHLAGGFYGAYLLYPGTYDVIIEKSKRYKTVYRPQIIGQVKINPGVRTILNITVHPGDTLERVSAPQMQTQKITLAATK